jgi:hypothetical protein
MITKIFLGAAAVATLVLACDGPEAFHGHLGVQVPGAAGTMAPAGAAGDTNGSGLAGTTGAAGIQVPPAGDAGTGGLAGSGPAGVGGPAGAGGPAGMGGPAGTSGAAGMGAAGTSGAAGMGQAGTGAGAAGTGSGRAGTGGGGAGTGGGADAGAQDAPVERPPSQPYATTGWKPTASITAAGNADVPTNAFDGMIGTRWSTGRAQQGNESFTIDLGSSKPVSRVVLDDMTHPTDFPAAYTLEVSTNNTAFTNVKMGTGSRLIDVQFTTVMARYVRIRQTGTTPTNWWSIDELKIYP